MWKEEALIRRHTCNKLVQILGYDEAEASWCDLEYIMDPESVDHVYGTQGRHNRRRYTGSHQLDSLWAFKVWGMA
jgi:hypothetical protein